MGRGAYIEGRWARALNRKVDDNPYSPGTPERAQWSLGWTAANYLYWWSVQLGKQEVAAPHAHSPDIYQSFEEFRLRRNMQDIQCLTAEVAKNIENLKQNLKKL